VYWTQHIGNLRGATCADLVLRTLSYNGYKTKMVRNYTDVGHLVSDEDAGEDKMDKAARRDKMSPNEIAQKYIASYEKDTASISLLEPDVKPRATDHIEEMIEIVGTLIKKGFAYETDLAVYFDVSKATTYTKLSGQVLSKNLAGAGSGEIEDSNKKNPHDFVLWFFAAGTHEHAIQTWKSPFNSSLVPLGHGFPGWHIECSAMSKKYLGSTFDIHMGGIEHVPVHHTNEIAQSEAVNGAPLCNYWLHNEHLLVDNGKMAKSVGTSYCLDDITAKGFDPLTLRYLFLTAHYRSKQNFTWESLEQARTAYNKIRTFVEEHLSAEKGEVLKDYEKLFLEAVNDDINIPKGLAVVWTMIRDNTQKPENIIATLFQFDKVLGLGLSSIKKTQGEVPDAIHILVNEREVARKEKKWQESDRIRDEINKLGYEIQDSDTGPKIEPKVK
jgi:cysteinyl-tRNA synthetase